MNTVYVLRNSKNAFFLCLLVFFKGIDHKILSASLCSLKVNSFQIDHPCLLRTMCFNVQQPLSSLAGLCDGGITYTGICSGQLSRMPQEQRAHGSLDKVCMCFQNIHLTQASSSSPDQTDFLKSSPLQSLLTRFPHQLQVAVQQEEHGPAEQQKRRSRRTPAELLRPQEVWRSRQMVRSASKRHAGPHPSRRTADFVSKDPEFILVQGQRQRPGQRQPPQQPACHRLLGGRVADGVGL